MRLYWFRFYTIIFYFYISITIFKMIGTTIEASIVTKNNVFLVILAITIFMCLSFCAGIEYNKFRNKEKK